MKKLKHFNNLNLIQKVVYHKLKVSLYNINFLGDSITKQM